MRARWLVPLLVGCTRTPVVTRAALAATMRQSLRHDLFAPWYPRAIDRDAGGYVTQFDYRWRPTGDQDKMIVTQARHLWTTSRAAQFFPGDTIYRPAAAHGFAFLRDVMWDARDGGFFWLVTRTGTPRPGPKQSYGEAFGIYGLAAYFDLSRDSSALGLARRAFQWLDGHAHDSVYGGYYQFLMRDGTPLPAGYGTDPPKDQNSSIHLMEAFTELYRVWPDSLLRERLAELLVLVRDRIRVDPGYLTLQSTADWRPLAPGRVSFGHDIETAYLMLEASAALGLANDTTTRRVAKQMVDHAVRNGWDSTVGGFYDEGYYAPGASVLTITHDTKNWWAQAEGLNTLLLFADLYPDDPLHYWDKFVTQWSYIDTYIIDHRYGGWYEGGVDKEPRWRTGLKGRIWKAAYHDGRALINVIQRLEGRAAARYTTAPYIRSREM